MSYSELKNLFVDGDTCGSDREDFKTVANDATNAVSTIVQGLSALGKVMVNAGYNDQLSIVGGDVAAIGGLIDHLAGELEHLVEIRECAEHQAEKRNPASARKTRKG